MIRLRFRLIYSSFKAHQFVHFLANDFLTVVCSNHLKDLGKIGFI